MDQSRASISLKCRRKWPFAVTLCLFDCCTASIIPFQKSGGRFSGRQPPPSCTFLHFLCFILLTWQEHFSLTANPFIIGGSCFLQKCRQCGSAPIGHDLVHRSSRELHPLTNCHRF